MDKSPVTKKSLIISLILSLIVLSFVYVSNIFNKSTTIVFCNVGQGDAAYIRVRNRIDILIDAGPNQDVLTCLGKYMPFFDKKIEIAILSHPQKDHMGGFINIVERYKIDRFMTLNTVDESKTYKALKTKLKEKKIPIFFPVKGEKIKILDGEIDFLWPSSTYVNNMNILGESNLNVNDLSLVVLFKEAKKSILFTGDISSNILENITENKINILKVPHHGSENGLSLNFLRLADPAIAVISVGKNNPYRHPAKKTLDLLEALKKNYLRTDIKGDIVFYIR